MLLPSVIGIDVGGQRKGFHAAHVPVGGSKISGLIHSLTPEHLVASIVSRDLLPQVIGIDCPSQCRLTGERTRLAERQLHQRGIRVQWTRRATHEAPEWMENGERLWELLAQAFPKAELIECFPTVASPFLGASTLSLPLALLSDHAKRRDWKDLVDACISVDVANRFLNGTSQSCGIDLLTGEIDEVGLIHF